jgi:hypothetical protein
MMTELPRLWRPVHNGELGPCVVARLDRHNNVLRYCPMLLAQLPKDEQRAVLRTNQALVTVGTLSDEYEGTLTLA